MEQQEDCNRDLTGTLPTNGQHKVIGFPEALTVLGLFCGAVSMGEEGSV